jgi:hypothetical protein
MPNAASPLPDSADFLAYLHELPRLIKSGDVGRVALIQGGRLRSVWDTPGDALQAGHDQFGPDADFLTQPISEKDLDARPPSRRATDRPAQRAARR